MNKSISLIIHDKAGAIQDELFVTLESVPFARGFVMALWANALITSAEHERLESELFGIRNEKEEAQAA